MTDIRIDVDDLSGPEIAALLTEHVHEMRTVTPEEYAFALDLDALRRPGITFWSAREDDTVVGCAALKRLDAEHAELKSMRTKASRQRSGVASRLLEHIIGEARRAGYTRLSLETGTDEYFRAARTLYEKFGFTYCEPFADYTASPYNTFMTRTV